MFPQRKNGESSSNPPPQLLPSQLQGLGLGSGQGFTESFARTFVADEEEGEWEDEDEEDDDKDVEEVGEKMKGKGKSKEVPQVEDPRTDDERAEAVRRITAAEQARATISDAALAAKGIEWNADSFFSGEREFIAIRPSAFNPQRGSLKTLRKRHDFFSNMANMPELLMELAKHLRIKELLSLYSISVDFHETINGHLSHCMRSCANYIAPEAAGLYPFKFYSWLCVDDPVGRENPEKNGEAKMVPSLKWLQMVVHREKTVRDILACMARQGHRMPQGMGLSLKKMWLLMDLSTTKARVQMMHNVRLFTDMDLYNIQFFVVKLDMRFNDPIDGPGTDGLRKLFLGQRGLTPLCNLLKRKAYLEVVDIVRLGIRYAYQPRPEHRGMEIFGVPPEEIGVMHTEGWGIGRVHLIRPDELIMRESVRRQMGLKNYIMNMMTWGYVDLITGQNIAVSEEEMYMSDEEVKPRDPHFNDYFETENDDEREEDFDSDDNEDEDVDMNENKDEEDDEDDEDDEKDDEEDDEEEGDEDSNYFFGTGAN